MGADGRFTLRSTKQTNRTKAMDVAIKYERAAREARSGTLTELQARKVLSDILESTTGDTIRHVSTETFLKDWLRDKEAAKSETTAARYKTAVNLFLEDLEDKAKKPINAVTPRDVQHFLSGRLKSGKASKTVSVDRKTLSAIFNTARRQGVITSNPVEATERIDVESTKREVFTHAEVKMLLDAAPTIDWRTAILLGYYTAARLSDCVNMTWDNVNLTQRTITFQQRKTGTEITLPLHASLEAHLSKIASTDNPERQLCPTLAGKSAGGAHGLSNGFKAIMREAGVDSRTVEGQGNQKFSKRTFHSLRHTFNSSLATANVSQEIRQLLTGHKSAEMNKTYTHHELQTLTKAVKKMPSLGR